MATNSKVYSNARAKSLENGMLTSEKLTRMTYATSLDEGVKILYESSYGGSVAIESSYDFEVLLQAERSAISAFLREAMPKDSGLECFLIQLDYHNAKAFMKAKYLRLEDVSFMLMPDGLIERSYLKDCIWGDNYINLPKQMQNALREIDFEFAQNGKSSRKIDVMLDKAMYQNITEFLEKSKGREVREYFISNINYINISNFVRCKSLSLDVNFFKEGFIAGGSITLGEFSNVYDQSIENSAEAFKFKRDGKMMTVASESLRDGGNLVAYEVATDNALINMFKKGRNDIFSVSPIAGLYTAKLIEIKMVRMILVCLKNDADKSLIKHRLREFYV